MSVYVNPNAPPALRRQLLAMRLESALAEREWNELGLEHLAPLRAEVAALAKPGPSARERAAAGPEQTALPLRREVAR